MRSKTAIRIVECHAEGEVGDVIVGGVAPPAGDTVWAQSRHIAEDEVLRNFVLNEPRGGVFRHVNLLVPPKHPEADAAFIIMEPADTPPMSGSNSLCVATVLLETGILPIEEPETRLTLEAPGGLVSVSASCEDGRVQSVRVRNLPSFADKLDTSIEVEGLGTLRVDTAFGGDSFVLVDANTLGFSLTPDEARDIAVLGTRITAAANAQLGFGADMRRYDLCVPMLNHLGITALKLMTNNPRKVDALTRDGVNVVERQPITTGLNPHNEQYLSTKAGKLGHMMALDDFTQASDVDIERKG